MILKTGEGILQYYQHWLKKVYDMHFIRTVWGSHISVNRGVEPPNPKKWGKYEGEWINFTYTNRIYRATDIFLCVDAYSPRLEEIRVELGLQPQPNYGFHLTIGRLDKRHHFKNEQQNKL